MFPERKPVDMVQVRAIVERVIYGSNDAAEFGGIVWGIKRATGGTFLTVFHGDNNEFTAIRCSKNTANAVLDNLASNPENLSILVYPQRF
jgi:hypothetical protein